MILTTLRIINYGNITNPLICNDTDLNTGLELVKIQIKHASKIYEVLSIKTTAPKQLNQKQQILNRLLSKFSRHNYLKTVKSFNFPDKAAEKHIAKFVQSRLTKDFTHNKRKNIDISINSYIPNN
jgi:hypothetical protein